MVRCSLFGNPSRSGKKKTGVRSASLSREETIASAFFCKCRRTPVVKTPSVKSSDEPSTVEVKLHQENDETISTSSLAPLL